MKFIKPIISIAIGLSIPVLVSLLYGVSYFELTLGLFKGNWGGYVGIAGITIRDGWLLIISLAITIFLVFFGIFNLISINKK